ncbi:hypothetical protein HID58_017001 [Brassica napus]|uniref:Uncharacterized protein n=1 Tax=Brassica napus TaxID=3708 RepID=A0ABQ8D8B2_BRANA|nr:hypothetical protein HID58_017001 [Brassica napus]
MWDQQPSFRFAIDDNFWEKEAGIASQVFVAGGCEWIPGWCFQNFPKKESLGVKFERLKTKRDQMMLMMGSRVQQVEESFKKLELVASDLKAEVHKDKAKSSDARFLLVDEYGIVNPPPTMVQP